MPLREYRCPKCGDIVEAFRWKSDKMPVLCGNPEHEGYYEMEQIEWSVPAKRNPKYGIG